MELIWFVDYFFRLLVNDKRRPFIPPEYERYFNFSGAPGARITREQSVRGWERRPLSSLTRFLSLLLFQVPIKRLTLLNGVYVDHQVKQVAFKSLTNKLVESWQAEVINVRSCLRSKIVVVLIFA